MEKFKKIKSKLLNFGIFLFSIVFCFFVFASTVDAAGMCVESSNTCKYCTLTGGTLPGAGYYKGGYGRAYCASGYDETRIFDAWADAGCWRSSCYGGWTSIPTCTIPSPAQYPTKVGCCTNSNCGTNPCKEYICSLNNCVEQNKSNGTSCGSGNFCYGGICTNPDNNQIVCESYVNWTCTGVYCMSQTQGHWKCTQGAFNCGLNYDVQKINLWPYGSQSCCGDDSGENALQTSYCSSSCSAGDTQINDCNCRRPNNSTYSIGPIKYSKNCCGPEKCARGTGCYSPTVIPVGAECYKYTWCYKFGSSGRIARGAKKNCSYTNTRCSRYKCVCQSGYADCDSNKSCECNLSTHKCESGSCVQSDVDCGFKGYDGASIVAFACEREGAVTSPLRIRRNGVTRGIILVNTTDSKASKFKIMTSSGIKAIKKL